jgi:hypothetical protein
MTATNPTTSTDSTTPLMADHGIKDAVIDSDDWPSAVHDAIAYFTSKGTPFSSGEIAAVLRTYRTDLRFAATRIGEMVRDGFYMGEIEYTDDDGDALPAVQVPRITMGYGRTPSGQMVFVYAPDQMTGEDHDFEVDIPKPGEVADGAQPVSAASIPPRPAPAPKPVNGPAIHGVPSGVDLRLTVHVDNRVCVTRSAFEALVHATGSPFQCGADVYVAFDGDEAQVTLSEATGATAHRLNKRGRILFANMAGGTTFPAGAVYSAEVVDEKLIIDVSKDLRK